MDTKTEARRTTTGLRLGRISGVDIHLDWSLLIIFVLVVTSLALGYFPAAHPDWSVAVVWATALVAGVLFFLSVLLHELAHALVGRRVGVPVRRITLFLFGGLAQMAGEPKSPKAELLMTIVGPLTSLFLGFLFTWLGWLFAPEAFRLGVENDPGGALAALGPVPTTLLWLGSINILLAVFNLLPGFPLDGGRVLRSAIWAITGDHRRATRIAAGIGRAFGWGLMALGILMAFGVGIPYLGVGIANGLWLVLIGWFLSNAARAGYEQVVVKDVLTDVPVTQLMKRNLASVPPSLTVAEFVETYVMQYEERCFPVREGDGPVLGLACADDVRRVERARWQVALVREIMVPSSELTVVEADDDALHALQTLGTRQVDQLPVVKDGAFLGLIRRKDIIRWLTLQEGAPQAV